MVELKEEKAPSSPSDNPVEIPVSLRDLLEAGVHFGHKKRRWNPKMARYIFGIRQDIHIIDLRKTIGLLENAYNKVRDIASKGGRILFVCTKKQGRDVVREQAERCGALFITERWLGGTFTNFETIKQRIEYLKDLERMKEEGKLKLLPRKEAAKLEKEFGKLQNLIGGIRDLESPPELMFVVDIVHEEIAVKEARKLGIPLVALVDTNSDPDVVNFVIPGNDDAIRSIKLISSVMADAVIEGRQGRDFLIAEKEMSDKTSVTEEATGTQEATEEKAEAEIPSEGTEVEKEAQGEPDSSDKEALEKSGSESEESPEVEGEESPEAEVEESPESAEEESSGEEKEPEKTV